MYTLWLRRVRVKVVVYYGWKRLYNCSRKSRFAYYDRTLPRSRLIIEWTGNYQRVYSVT